METFSDGVFAVALTLLIIDISTTGLPILDPTRLPPDHKDWWPDFGRKP
jgi:hypothetical protein